MKDIDLKEKSFPHTLMVQRGVHFGEPVQFNKNGFSGFLINPFN